MEHKTYNNSNVFISNDQSTQNIIMNINNQHNNVEELKQVLRENQVEESDIQGLLLAIKKDKSCIERKELGENIRKWQKNMLGKAVDGSWKIGVTVAAGLITKVLSNYLGLPL